MSYHNKISIGYQAMVINTFQLFHKQIFFCKSRKKPKKQNITEQQIANRSDMDRYIGD